jgi:hypothetical protein
MARPAKGLVERLYGDDFANPKPDAKIAGVM